MTLLVSKKSNYTGIIEEERLKNYLADVDQDIQNLFQMSAPITFGYGTSNNVLVNQGGWSWAASGTIGGWSITGSLLYAGSGSTYIGLQPGVGIWAGDEAFLNGAFSVDPNGVVKAHSGTIGGWNLSTTRLYSTNILIDSANEYIRTVDYSSGALGSGWNIDNTIAEFNNIRARGKFVSSVFEKDTISAVGGNFLVADSDILDADMGTSDASTLKTLGDTTFAVNDVLRIRDGVDDEWFTVTAVSSTTYTVTRDRAGDYTANQNPAWKKGTAVVNFGASGEGLVFMTASEANAPHIDVLTHAGSPWTTTTTRVRLGNLNGYLGYSSDLYGIAIGEATKYLKYDPTNGLQIKGNIFATTGTLSTLYVDGSLIVESGGLVRSGQTDYNNGTGFWLGNDGGTPKFSIGNSASVKTLTWDGTNLEVANVRSPDYSSGVAGYFLSADSGLEINAGTIQGTPLIAKLMVYAMMFGS